MNERDDRVFRYAAELAVAKDGRRVGHFRPSVFLDVLLFPKVTKRAPVFWKEYAERWEWFHGLDQQPGLSASSAAVVLHVIGSAVEADDSGAATCFLNDATIASRAHVSRRTVVRVQGWQRVSPAPLFMLTKPGNTRGIKHGSLRFTLIENPIAFAAKRDSARAKNVTAAKSAADRLAAEVHEERINLQKSLFMNLITQEQYDQQINDLEARIDREARGNLPRSVVLRQIGAQRVGHALTGAEGR